MMMMIMIMIMTMIMILWLLLLLLPLGAWSAFREWFPGTYGYGRLKVVNTTHLYWEQRHAWDGDVIDSIWIKQEKHGPFKPLNETFDNPSYS